MVSESRYYLYIITVAASTIRGTTASRLRDRSSEICLLEGFVKRPTTAPRGGFADLPVAAIKATRINQRRGAVARGNVASIARSHQIRLQIVLDATSYDVFNDVRRTTTEMQGEQWISNKIRLPVCSLFSLLTISSFLLRQSRSRCFPTYGGIPLTRTDSTKCTREGLAGWPAKSERLTAIAICPVRQNTGPECVLPVR